MSVSMASIMSKRASCVIQCVGEWDTSWRGKSGPCGCTRSLFPSQTICVHMPPLMFAVSVTVTKAREAKTWVDSAFLGPPALARWNHAHSCLVQVPHAIVRDSETIAQVDDAQLQEFAFSGNVGPHSACGGCESPRASMISAELCRNCLRPSSAGLEFDVKLAQHTAVDVLPRGRR